LPPSPEHRNDTLTIVMSVTIVSGMAVALVLIFLWRSYPATMTQGGAYHLAVALCPPFFLVGVVSALSESMLAEVLTAGTIVMANGSLYAGLAALVYWAWSIWGRQNKLS
jgi:hypothetical protein